MVVRKLAGIALAAGVLMSVSGCSFNPEPETLQSYAPSDGVGVEVSFTGANGKVERNQSVAFRNFLIATDGTHFTLHGSVVNSGTRSQSVEIHYGKQVETVKVGPSQVFTYGVQNLSKFNFSGSAGSTVSVYVGAAGALKNTFKLLSVPIVDDTIGYYSNAVVTPSASASPEPTATPVATPSATPTE